MKYKKLSNEQILISIDRLTRFKPTKEKYLRVYTDIITSSLLEPKLKKNDIQNTDYKLLSSYVSDIFNFTLGENKDNQINYRLKEYENNVFINDDETQKLLDNDINYANAIKLISDDAPINLLWLKNILNNNYKRENQLLRYPIEKVVLVEGITEEILLPAFSDIYGYNFDGKGIQVVAAGGKNQVVKMYYKLIEEIKLPVFVLLDKDAEENINQIKPKLRNIDKIHLVSCGEFEDLLPKALIVKTVNSHFKNFLKITEKDITSDLPMAKILEELFKTKGLHEFKKAEFAELVKENINSKNDLSEEIITILNELSQTNK